jgi:hypothetical protein
VTAADGRCLGSIVLDALDGLDAGYIEDAALCRRRARGDRSVDRRSHLHDLEVRPAPSRAADGRSPDAHREEFPAPM